MAKITAQSARQTTGPLPRSIAEAGIATRWQLFRCEGCETTVLSERDALLLCIRCAMPVFPAEDGSRA